MDLRPFIRRLVFSTTGFFDDCYNSTKIYSTTVFSTTDTIRRPFFRRLILFDDRFFDDQDFSTTSFLADFLRSFLCDKKFFFTVNFFTVNRELRRERPFGIDRGGFIQSRRDLLRANGLTLMRPLLTKLELRACC